MLRALEDQKQEEAKDLPIRRHSCLGFIIDHQENGSSLITFAWERRGHVPLPSSEMCVSWLVDIERLL